jgi:hypothetical protein
MTEAQKEIVRCWPSTAGSCAIPPVLMATDFSDPSRQALELGLRLAPGAKIYLLHACLLRYELQIRVYAA